MVSSNKYQDKIPIILERGDVNLPLLEKNKFLVDPVYTLNKFVHVISKRISKDSKVCIFISIKNIGIKFTGDEKFADLFEKYKNEKNYLNLVYHGENVFG